MVGNGSVLSVNVSAILLRELLLAVRRVNVDHDELNERNCLSIEYDRDVESLAVVDVLMR